MNKYIQEGGRSFRELKGRYINPYRRGSPQYNDFERGWSQALKRSPEQLRRDYRASESPLKRQETLLPTLTPVRNKRKLPEDIYKVLESRAQEKLQNDPTYQRPRHRWRTNVYYARIEAYEMPLWKIGVTSNNFDSRYCVADRRRIVPIQYWKYASRGEAIAIEKGILAEFAKDIYKGGPVLRSGGDSELFIRDVLMLDSQEDFFAIMRRESAALDRL